MSQKKTSVLNYFVPALAVGMAVLFAAGCSKKASVAECSGATSCTTVTACNAACTQAAACAKPGGPVAGAADTHCTTPTVKTQVTDPGVCTTSHALGWPRQAEAVMPAMDVGETLYNSEGDDDDCKYHVTFSSTSLCKDSDVFFIVHAKKRADGSVLKGANPYVELYHTDDTSLPTATVANTTEGPDGTYAIGPYKMPVSGRWTVRFHFFGNCDDTMETSPHGHVAFFVDVP